MAAIDDILGRAEAGTCSPGDVRELAELVRFQRDLLAMAKEAQAAAAPTWYMSFWGGFWCAMTATIMAGIWCAIVLFNGW